MRNKVPRITFLDCVGGSFAALAIEKQRRMKRIHGLFGVHLLPEKLWKQIPVKGSGLLPSLTSQLQIASKRQ
jgi:hypothetical protein